MLEFFALSFFAGGLVKLADFRPVACRLPISGAGFLASFWAGLIVGYLISVSGVFSTVFIGVIAANLAFGRLDKREHQLFLVPVILLIAVLGLHRPVLPLLLFFAVFAFLDEHFHELFSLSKKNKKSKQNELLSLIAQNRLLTELFALLLFFAGFGYEYFLAILTFDAGYLACSRLYG